MGISLEQFRSRIGRFLPNLRRKVQSSVQFSTNYVIKPRTKIVSVVLQVVLIFIIINQQQDIKYLSNSYSSVNKCQYPLNTQQVSCYIKLSNFMARYTYGNRSNRGVKVAHFNKGPGYLTSKIQEIEKIVSDLHPHVLGISEANFFEGQNFDDVQISDYRLHTCPTLENPDIAYSRIVVYTHKSLVCKLRPDLMDEKCSSIWMQVGLPGQKQILICQVYREWQILGQDNDTSKSLAAQFDRWKLFINQWERALNTGQEVLVLGDININHLDWALPAGRQSSQTYKLKLLIEELFNRILPFSVSQCVTVPTRFMQGQSPTGLDHFYTNRPEKLSVVQSKFCGSSDHKIIFTTRYSKSMTKNARYIVKRCYKNFSLKDFLMDLAKISWLDLYLSDDVNIAVDLFYDKYVSILDLHAPIRTIQTRKKYVPWLSDKTKKMIEERNNAQKIASRTQSVDDWNKFKKLRNRVTNILKNEKSDWQREKLKSCSGKPNEQWQCVLSWLGWKACMSPSQLFYEGKLLTKPLEIADCLNEFFVTKIKTIQENFSPTVSDPLAKLRSLMQSQTSSFNLKTVHPDIVENILMNLKNSKSAGLDMVDTNILKCSVQYILPAITHLINLSIVKGCFPGRWKIAKIIPLLKKDDPLNPRNYRPVAILPVLSKVLEKVIFCQVVQYFEENQFLHPNHHGFRPAHSTTTSLIQMYDNWVDAAEKKKFTGICLLDLSAAFDVVNHSLLLQKLRLYGFSEHSLNLIHSYLSDRKQTVHIDGKQSTWLNISSGVPQGSILGPLLYTLFTNELPELVHDHRLPQNHDLFNMHCDTCGALCCYADDSSFSFASSSLDTLSETLKEKYDRIADFMNSNKLKLNGEKTHLMLLSTDRNWRSHLTEDSLTLVTSEDEPPVKTAKSEKLLGCVISQNLKWTEYILHGENSLIQQLGKRINVLKFISSVANFRTRKMFANGLFQSKLIYLIPLWGGCEKFLLKGLQTVQNRAARVITRLGIYTSTKTLLRECCWLSVTQLVFFHSVVLLHKTRLAKSPRFLYEMAKEMPEPKYDTRASREKKLLTTGDQMPSQQLSWNSFRWRAVRSWNMLPLSLREVTNISKFKRDLKHWIMENVEIE